MSFTETQTKERKTALEHLNKAHTEQVLAMEKVQVHLRTVALDVKLTASPPPVRDPVEAAAKDLLHHLEPIHKVLQEIDFHYKSAAATLVKS